MYTITVRFSGGSYSLREGYIITVGGGNPNTGAMEPSPLPALLVLGGVVCLLLAEARRRQG